MDTLSFILGAVVIIGLFFVLREFFLWYWKVSEIVSILKKIDENTKKDQKKELAAGPDIVEKQAREQKERLTHPRRVSRLAATRKSREGLAPA